jgi:hypothetical protein
MSKPTVVLIHGGRGGLVFKLYHPGEGPILVLRHESTKELREFAILEADYPPRFRIHWPMCGDYYLDLRTNRLRATFRGKRGKTEGARAWRATEFAKMLTAWNDALMLYGNSRVQFGEPL